jgi:uncharacterized protein YbaR (Trm112 family)
MDVDRELLAILACPHCRHALRHLPEQDALICDSCRVSFPIVDGIPDLLPESARSIDAKD